jgi:hypothetical protein
MIPCFLLRQLGGRQVRQLHEHIPNSDSFTTNFRGSNDVTVTLVSGNGPAAYTEWFGGASSGNNPGYLGYLKNFVGSFNDGTGGDGVGVIQTLEMTGGSTNSLQFDFAQSLRLY